MTVLKKTWIVLLLLVTAGASFAQVFEFGGGGGASRISNRTLAGTPPDNVDLKDGFRINFHMALNTYTHLGGEVGYTYVRTNWTYTTVGLDGSEVQSEAGTAAHQVNLNPLLYLTPEGSKVRPFVTGGVGFTSFAYPGYSVTYGGSQLKFGVNYGAGVKVRVTEKYLMQLDYRQFLVPKPDFNFATAPQGWLRMNAIMLCVAYTM